MIEYDERARMDRLKHALTTRTLSLHKNMSPTRSIPDPQSELVQKPAQLNEFQVEQQNLAERPSKQREQPSAEVDKNKLREGLRLSVGSKPDKIALAENNQPLPKFLRNSEFRLFLQASKEFQHIFDKQKLAAARGSKSTTVGRLIEQPPQPVIQKVPKSKRTGSLEGNSQFSTQRMTLKGDASIPQSVNASSIGGHGDRAHRGQAKGDVKEFRRISLSRLDAISDNEEEAKLVAPIKNISHLSLLTATDINSPLCSLPVTPLPSHRGLPQENTSSINIQRFNNKTMPKSPSMQSLALEVPSQSTPNFKRTRHPSLPAMQSGVKSLSQGKGFNKHASSSNISHKQNKYSDKIEQILDLDRLRKQQISYVHQLAPLSTPIRGNVQISPHPQHQKTPSVLNLQQVIVGNQRLNEPARLTRPSRAKSHETINVNSLQNQYTTAAKLLQNDSFSPVKYKISDPKIGNFLKTSLVLRRSNQVNRQPLKST